MPEKKPRYQCRHCQIPWEVEWEYCPACNRNYGGAIYPAKQTEAELAEVKSVVNVIREAFAGVEIDGGVTIHEADLEGVCSEGGRLKARAKDPEVDWREVPDWKIESFPDALAFFDVKGWRFYIPAYMIWTLENWHDTDLIVSDYTVWGFDTKFSSFRLPRYQSLTPEQSHAVYRFLKYFCDYIGEESAVKAVDLYWHQFEAGRP